MQVSYEQRGDRKCVLEKCFAFSHIFALKELELNDFFWGASLFMQDVMLAL